jgi:hypothetical protein
VGKIQKMPSTLAIGNNNNELEKYKPNLMPYTPAVV